MKAKLAAFTTAVGLAWMANGLAGTDRTAGAHFNRLSAPIASAEESRESSSAKTDRDGKESMMNGRRMMEGRNMMDRMMSNGMMSGGMMEGCPMMGGSQPNKQWRNRRSEK